MLLRPIQVEILNRKENEDLGFADVFIDYIRYCLTSSVKQFCRLTGGEAVETTGDRDGPHWEAARQTAIHILSSIWTPCHQQSHASPALQTRSSCDILG